MRHDSNYTSHACTADVIYDDVGKPRHCSRHKCVIKGKGGRNRRSYEVYSVGHFSLQKSPKTLDISHRIWGMVCISKSDCIFTSLIRTFYTISCYVEPRDTKIMEYFIEPNDGPFLQGIRENDWSVNKDIRCMPLHVRCQVSFNHYQSKTTLTTWYARMLYKASSRLV